MERILGLSSVLVDVAGSRVGAAMLFRGVDDADELLRTLVGVTRAVRVGVPMPESAARETKDDLDQPSQSSS